MIHTARTHSMRGSRNYCQAGSRAYGQYRALTTFFLSTQLILQFTDGVQWFCYRENYTFPWIQRGSNIFQGGGGRGPTFSRGVQMLISIETHITCDFPGGPDPLSPSGCAHAQRTRKRVMMTMKIQIGPYESIMRLRVE